ncbi:MAG: prenyltransferase [Myxococcota bacterium]
MGKVRAWWRASRPLAQANIAAPLLLGQGLAFAVTERFSWPTLLWLGAFGIADQLFIVYANDYADRDDDGDARTPFSGGSGVLQDGLLTPNELRVAAVIAALAMVAIGIRLSVHAPALLGLVAAALLLMQAYSFHPLRLSYRGGGEWLQGLGVGGVLPLMGFTAQAGSFEGFPWPLLIGTVGLAAAGNVATALPDEAGDAACGKRTWPVRFGLKGARYGGLLLSAASLAVIAAVGHARFDAAAIGFAAVFLGAWCVPFTTRGRVLLAVFAHGLAMQSAFLGLPLLAIVG